MIRDILVYPDPKLYEISNEVDLSKLSEYQSLINDLFETMYYNDGLGLSAIQIGEAKRILVADTGKTQIVMINPLLIRTTGNKASLKEGCLSLPGVFDYVVRYPIVLIQYYDRDGKLCLFNTNIAKDTLIAQVLQHELEHLDGQIFIDKLSSFKKSRMIKKLKQNLS